MDGKDQELKELLIGLASSLKEEDLLEDPELADQLKLLMDTIDPQNELDPAVIQQLAQIPDKQERFMAAIQMLQVQPDPQSLTMLVEAMQKEGLLNKGNINFPGEQPKDEALDEEQSEEPLYEDDEGFDPEDDSQAEDVDMEDKDVMAAGTHRW